ncbi:MAG TPA: PAS domain-containing protein [Actinospica sp.]|nr:PAS domain-containing protein [Actinospica sp.]
MGPTNRTPVRGAARLAAILDALPDALLLVDGSGAIVNANAAALGLFEGESAQRLLGRPITEVLPGLGRTVATPGSAPAALPAGPSAAALDPRALAGAPVRRPPERMAARRTDGSVFPAEVTTAELTEEDDSALTLHVVRDLTGVLDVEGELRRQQRQIELILRAASEGIIGVDHEGRIVLVNPAGAKILRYRAADLGGQNVHELLTHSRADGTPLPDSECPLLDSVRTGAKHRAVDSVLWRSDGGPVYVDLTTAPVYEGENIIGAVMTFVDNSAARTAARQAAELTNVLDKDLRGALEEAAGRLQQLAGADAGYVAAGYPGSGYAASAAPLLEEVGADLERLAVLTADVVDFQQAVLGNLEYDPETVELGDVVDAAVETAAPAAGAAGVQITAHCAEVEVELDPELFVKLLAHLLADMVSVSPVGGKIVVTAARRGALARIEIRGPHTGGGPLHLPIAQAVAARHGGTVTTHRIAGKGNTHVIEVPVTQPSRPERPGGAKAVGSAHRAELPGRRSALSASAEGQAAEPAPESAEQQPEAAADEVTKSNGHHASPGVARRRRAAAATDMQGRIPAQSRSTLSRSSVGSLEDLRPSKPMPTGDVWSKPDRGQAAEAVPGRPQQDTDTLPGAPTEPAAPATPAEAQPGTRDSGSDTGEFARPWQAESEPPTPQPAQGHPQPEPVTPQAAAAQAAASPAAEPAPGLTPPTVAPRGRRRAAATEAEQTETLAPVPATPEPEPPAARDSRFPARPVPVAMPAEAAAESAEPEPVPAPVAEPEPEGPRLLLWPDPDEHTADLLRGRGYEPVPLGQPERLPVLAANGSGEPHPFAVFVDPIAAPITRRGLRELRAASTKAGLPLLVTAGIGRAAQGQGLGPDPSLLLTALCPPEVRLPRVLLVEARTDLAEALAEMLERQGMQVAHATTDAESRESAVAAPPDLVLLDLMQIRRRRVGVVDWLRDRGLLSRTPLVVYTAEGSDTGGFETLYLTERATDAEPGGRIGDLLAKIAP